MKIGFGAEDVATIALTIDPEIVRRRAQELRDACKSPKALQSELKKRLPAGAEQTVREFCLWHAAATAISLSREPFIDVNAS